MTAGLVFITGASSGIGQALAAHYAAAGWRLALVARRRVQTEAWARAQGLLGAADADGGDGRDAAARAVVYGADVTVPDSIRQAAEECLARQGLPDLVIANAGISVGIDSAEPADLAVLSETLATNTVGVAATFQPFLRRMRARGSGTLVGMASVAAVRGLPGHGAYCASKAAVVAYCESLRGECRGQGVRVVVLLPGFIATPLTAANPYPMPFLLPAARFAELAARAIASGRSRSVIPWQMAIVARLLPLLPDAIFDRVFASRARKPRRAARP